MSAGERRINLVKECPACSACYDIAMKLCAEDGCDQIAIKIIMDSLFGDRAALHRHWVERGLPRSEDKTIGSDRPRTRADNLRRAVGLYALHLQNLVEPTQVLQSLTALANSLKSQMVLPSAGSQEMPL